MPITVQNKLSPNAPKALDKINIHDFHNNLRKWWIDEDLDYEDWHVAPLKPLPKKGDLSNPNNWREIVLMKISSKVLATVINFRLQDLLMTYGIRNQSGATPGTGCPDAVFPLKTILQERKNKNLDTWALLLT